MKPVKYWRTRYGSHKMADHVCGLQGFNISMGDSCQACVEMHNRADLAKSPKLTLYRGHVNRSESCSGCYILVLAATERHATDRIWDEVRTTFLRIDVLIVRTFSLLGEPLGEAEED